MKDGEFETHYLCSHAVTAWSCSRENNKLNIWLYCSIVHIKQLVFKILGPAAFSEHDPVYNAESIFNPRIAWGVTQYYSHTACF